MNLLIIDQTGVSLDIALRAKSHGHNVRVYIRRWPDGSRCEVGDGMIQRVPHWEAHMNWADLIFVCDNTYYIHMLEHWRNKGYPIYGPSVAATEWEQDRMVGDSVFNRAGIKTIPMQKFKDYDKAIAHVVETNKRYVSKPVGDGDKELSYVSKTPADLVFMLQKWKRAQSYGGEFVLQEMRKGVEMAVGGWFGLGGFSKWYNENWEFKKLMNGDLGVATGEQGTVMRYTQKSQLADIVLKPLEDLLHGLDYTGYIDVNCIIDKDGTPWPLEFTMRPGWPHFQICQALHKGDPIEWMLDSIHGKDTLHVSEDVATGVVISIPDYPYGGRSPKECSGFPLFNLEEKDVLKNVHLSYVQCGKAPAMVDGEVKMAQEMYVTAGSYVCTVSGTGSTIEESRDKVYANIKSKIEIPNSISYRTDIGCRLEEHLPQLKANGYCRDLKYE